MWLVVGLRRKEEPSSVKENLPGNHHPLLLCSTSFTHIGNQRITLRFRHGTIINSTHYTATSRHPPPEKQKNKKNSLFSLLVLLLLLPSSLFSPLPFSVEAKPPSSKKCPAAEKGSLPLSFSIASYRAELLRCNTL